MLIFKILTLFTFICTNAYALPKSFEVWFISTMTTRPQIEESYLRESVRFSPLFAATTQCQPMGDYCFDPQIGLYKMSDSKVVELVPNYDELDKAEKYKTIDGASSLDRQLIDCSKDKSQYDIFCGKAAGSQQVNSKLELWIDTSSTMRQVDFWGHEQACFRERFVSSIHSECRLNQDYKLYIFDTSIKEAGTIASVCLNYGLNNYNRIIEKLQKSTADHVVIITDIFEADSHFVDFIEGASGRGKHKGLDKPLLAKDLMAESTRILGSCKK